MSNPKKFATHHENLYKVCILCFKKCNGDKLTDLIKGRIFQIKQPTLSFEDERMPKVICSCCRRKLPQVLEGKISSGDLPFYDFSQISLRQETREFDLSTIYCNCLICDTARQMGARPKTNVGRPKSESSFIASPIGTRCSKCLSIIGKGIKHDCSEKSLLSNMQKLSEKHPRTSEVFISSQINKKAEQNQTDTISLATKGLPCTITSKSKSSKSYVSRALFPDETIPSSEISKIQVACNLSNSQTSKMCTMMKSLKGRGSIESNVKENLVQRDRKLEKFFEIKKLSVDVKDSKTKEIIKADRTAVVCNDVDSLVKFIIDERGLAIHDTRVRLGLDGGKGSLKITLNILTKQAEDLNSPIKKATRYSYAQGSQSRKFQDSGVKKLIIIAIIENVTESYDNIKLLLDELDLEKIEHFSTLDLKALNIICGIESPGAASFPCPFCETARVDFKSVAEESEIVYRTVGSLDRHYENYRLKRLNSRAKTLSAKEDKNVKRRHLIKAPPDVLTLDIFPPMELHLLLGVVNNIYDHLNEALIAIKSPMKLIKWPEALHIQQPKYHDGDFEGNQCNKLLENLDQLQRMIENAGFQTAAVALPFLKAFRDFKSVKDSCFGMKLDQNFKRTIHNFRRSILALDTSVTLKMHIIFTHVAKFCVPRRKGLGAFSEQSTESCHSDFHSHRENFKLPAMSHEQYSEKLLKCLIAYNSRHV